MPTAFSHQHLFTGITTRLMAACLVACYWFPAFAQTTAPEKWKTLEENWYIMEMGGSKIGWMCTITESDGSRYRTTERGQFKVERGSASVSINSDSVFLETADGQPLSMEYTQNTASQTVHTTWEFNDGQVTQISTQGGRETRKELPAPKGQWLPPAAADRYTSGQVKTGAKEFSYRTIDPENGLTPVAISSKQIGEDKFEVNGKPVPVTVWKSTNDIIKDLETTDKITGEGDLVFQETPTGIGNIVMRLATREQAQAKGVGGGPEILTGSFIKPDKPIERPHQTVKTRLKLQVKSGTMPELPSAGAQRVESASDGKSAVLTIDVNNNRPASEEEIANQDFLSDSAMLAIDDPMVKELSKKGAKGAGEDPMARAEAMRKLVHKHISKKGFETAFATASETARTRTGDCSEHGVLLCALLRANGIPARVATGLIYVDHFMGEQGIFGWHMWTQALIDGRWVDFDATMPRRYNATHILAATSSLKEGFGAADLGSIIRLIGNLNVQVLEVEYNAESASDAVKE